MVVSSLRRGWTTDRFIHSTRDRRRVRACMRDFSEVCARMGTRVARVLMPAVSLIIEYDQSILTKTSRMMPRCSTCAAPDACLVAMTLAALAPTPTVMASRTRSRERRSSASEGSRRCLKGEGRCRLDRTACESIACSKQEPATRSATPR